MTNSAAPLRGRIEVQQRLPFHLKALRNWVREAQIGVLEIKKRGIDMDPVVRRRLRLGGPNSATMVISRTPSGAIAARVERPDLAKKRDPRQRHHFTSPPHIHFALFTCVALDLPNAKCRTATAGAPKARFDGVEVRSTRRSALSKGPAGTRIHRVLMSG